jgi:hypothetical protein
MELNKSDVNFQPSATPENLRVYLCHQITMILTKLADLNSTVVADRERYMQDAVWIDLHPTLGNQVSRAGYCSSLLDLSLTNWDGKYPAIENVNMAEHL